MDEVIRTPNGGWAYKSEYEKMGKIASRIFARIEHELMFGVPDDVKQKRIQRKKPRLVYAFIMVGNTRKMCFYDGEQQIAYKIDGYKETNIKWPKFKFVRFCRPMDI